MAGTVQLTPKQEEDLYHRLRERVNELAFGYGTAGGAELVMLKEFYTPQDAMYFLDMPRDDFFTAEEFAEMERIETDEAAEILKDMAQRANIFHEVREDGKDYYHTIPAAHGIYEFHTRWLEPGWVGKGLIPTMSNPEAATYTFNAGIPFYHAMPIGPEVVKEGELLDEDNLWELLKTKRRFAVCKCDCLAISRDMFVPDQCDHPTGVCIQTDGMADYYLDDIDTGAEISYEQAKAILENSVKNGLVPQTTFSKKSEIFCSCGLCHCGILKGSKNFPGDANKNQTRYVIEHDKDACVKCGACAKKCPMSAITMDEETGFPVLDHSCVGCGHCVKACPQDARILARKPAEQIRDYAENLWESYAWMEEHRRKMGRL